MANRDEYAAGSIKKALAPRGTVIDRLINGIVSPPSSLLSGPEQQAAQRQAQLAAISALFTPRPGVSSFGGLAAGLQAAQQATQGAEQMQLQRRLIESQIAKNLAVRQSATTDPAAVREFQFVQKLSPEERELYWKVKRQQPGIQLRKITGPRGEEIVVLFDPDTGTSYDFSGRPISSVKEDKAPEKLKDSDTKPGKGPSTGMKYEPRGFTGLGVGPTPGEVEAEKLRQKDSAQKDIDRPKRAAAAQSALEALGNQSAAIDNALEQVNATTSGFFGALTQDIPGSPSRDLQATIDNILSTISLDRLQQMRLESPTGGALGNVSEGELKLLGESMRNVAQSQSPGQLRRNLRDLKRIYNQIEQKILRQAEADTVDIDALERPTKTSSPLEDIESQIADIDAQLEALD